MLKTKVPAVFKTRRSELMRRSYEQNKKPCAFVFLAAPEVIRNDDVHFPYRQDSSFYYLTGLDEPNSALILVSDPKDPAKKFKTVLFVQPRVKDAEIWTGERYGIDRAISVFGADESYLIEDLEKTLVDLFKGIEQVYYRSGLSVERDQLMQRVLEKHVRIHGRSGKALLPLFDPRSIVGEMRLFKSPEELDLMRTAGKISAAAHVEAMKQTRAGMNEYEIEALLEYVFKKNGCHRHAYHSIVAGGNNATCLHYNSNNEELRDGDLLLIDAGGEYDYMASDITRTFPIGKKFTKEQAEIYEIVLKAQKACISIIKPGIRYSDITDKANEVLNDGLVGLGLLQGTAKENVESGKLKKYYPHNIGHWLGMDVHDAGLYKIKDESRLLEAGMVLTVEPGLYFQPNEDDYPEKYRGIGIRIEDDVLVTASGSEVLTKDVPKEISEIEKLRA